jgi:hypothetical protein
MLHYGDLNDGRVLCLQRQVARSVVIAIFSEKRGPGQGAQWHDSTTQMYEFFVFPELILFQDLILFHDFILISGFGYRFPRRFSGFQDFNLFS